MNSSHTHTRSLCYEEHTDSFGTVLLFCLKRYVIIRDAPTVWSAAKQGKQSGQALIYSPIGKHIVGMIDPRLLFLIPDAGFPVPPAVRKNDLLRDFSSLGKIVHRADREPLAFISSHNPTLLGYLSCLLPRNSGLYDKSEKSIGQSSLPLPTRTKEHEVVASSATDFPDTVFPIIPDLRPSTITKPLYARPSYPYVKCDTIDCIGEPTRDPSCCRPITLLKQTVSFVKGYAKKGSIVSRLSLFIPRDTLFSLLSMFIDRHHENIDIPDHDMMPGEGSLPVCQRRCPDSR